MSKTKGKLEFRINEYLKNNLLKLKVRSKDTTDYFKVDKDNIMAIWWRGEEGNNWGDALNPFLINNLSGKNVIHYEDIDKKHKKNKLIVYSVIGSILGKYKIANLTVWGSGFISSSAEIKKPLIVHAVRGPLTREKLLKQGIECPEIYGDPALLYPLFYKPEKTKKYALGIIPHFIDQNSYSLNKFKKDENILIIDVLGDINKFIDDICSCRMIASSSLHGLIAADAYGVPSVWIELSNRIQGNRFKFYDYFSSVGRNINEPLLISEKTTLGDIENSLVDYTIKIDLLKLLCSCPFVQEKKLEMLRFRLKELIAEGYIKNDGINLEMIL